MQFEGTWYDWITLDHPRLEITVDPCCCRLFFSGLDLFFFHATLVIG